MSSQTPRTDALKAQGIEWVPIGRMKDVESELTATRARLAELEGIAEKMHEAIEISKVYGMFILPSAVKAYEAYKEGKK